MSLEMVATLLSAVQIAVFLVIVWLVLSALDRIGNGIEDLTQAVRRMEPKG